MSLARDVSERTPLYAVPSLQSQAPRFDERTDGGRMSGDEYNCPAIDNAMLQHYDIYGFNKARSLEPIHLGCVCTSTAVCSSGMESLNAM